MIGRDLDVLIAIAMTRGGTAKEIAARVHVSRFSVYRSTLALLGDGLIRTDDAKGVLVYSITRRGRETLAGLAIRFVAALGRA